MYTGTIQTVCDPLNCFGYILPEAAAAPWVMVLGERLSVSRSSWNQKVDTPASPSSASTATSASGGNRC